MLGVSIYAPSIFEGLQSLRSKLLGIGIVEVLINFACVILSLIRLGCYYMSLILSLILRYCSIIAI